MSWINDESLSEEERKKLRRQYLLRQIIRLIGRTMAAILTRTKITGRENIPTEGPVIFAGNHMSTYDAAMMLLYLPKSSQILGPGDFKLLWPANVVVENIGVIMVKRGSVDRQSMKAMENVLKKGGFLGLFPEGGTWEKGIEDVKSGAAYLSLSTGARIVPVAIGGTYQVWNKIFRLKRPQITMHFCEPLPAVTLSGDRKRRQQELQEASVELMKVIYQYLPSEDQKMYDDVPRQRFHATLSLNPPFSDMTALPQLSGLTELISKPNLFSPLHKNAKLPLDPFTVALDQWVSAQDLYGAAAALKNAFETDFKGYLEYRLGEEKAERIYQDLEALLPIAAQAQGQNAQIRLTPHMELAPIETEKAL